MVSQIKTIAKIVLVTQNWVTVFMCVFIFNKKVEAVFRSGFRLWVDLHTWSRFISCAGFFRHFPRGRISGQIAQFTYLGKELKFDFSGLGAPGVLAEFFGKSLPYKIKQSDVLKIKDRVVVDVGAGLGDSMIWFAMNGAKKVYAFEPMPPYFELCKQNIKLNNLEEKCEIFHAGISGVASKDLFRGTQLSPKELGLESYIGTDYKREVPAYTLADVITNNNIGDGAFLKMDCEGYEYDIFINSSDATLRVFRTIMMEYHFGHERLKSRLESAGFRVSYTNPRYSYQPEADEKYRNLYYGYIFAERA
jgi:FkbM family methyltransferase